jgi:hypothetical protein
MGSETAVAWAVELAIVMEAATATADSMSTGLKNIRQFLGLSDLQAIGLVRASRLARASKGFAMGGNAPAGDLRGKARRGFSGSRLSYRVTDLAPFRERESDG